MDETMGAEAVDVTTADERELIATLDDTIETAEAFEIAETFSDEDAPGSETSDTAVVISGLTETALVWMLLVFSVLLVWSSLSASPVRIREETTLNVKKAATDKSNI